MSFKTGLDTWIKHAHLPQHDFDTFICLGTNCKHEATSNEKLRGGRKHTNSNAMSTQKHQTYKLNLSKNKKTKRRKRNDQIRKSDVVVGVVNGFEKRQRFYLSQQDRLVRTQMYRRRVMKKSNSMSGRVSFNSNKKLDVLNC